MIIEDIIDVNLKQLRDFDFLCKTIKNHSIDVLAVTFLALNKVTIKLNDKDKLNYKVKECDFPLKKDEMIEYSKCLMKIPVIENNFSSRASHWNWIKEFKENLEEYIWVYNLFSDDLSKRVFHRILLSRFIEDSSYYLSLTNKYLEYFDKNLLTRKPSAIYIDCGAFDGDTVMSFIANYSSDYKKIYAYEPMSDHFAQLKKNTATLRDVEARNYGVGETEAVLSFCSRNDAESFVDYRNSVLANNAVSVVSLDNDIDMPVTFIKMDIEGSEIPALKGAKHHIINDKPQLAIAAYHLMDDLRNIPKLIYSYNKNQKFYLRNHIADFVFYADPL